MLSASVNVEALDPFTKSQMLSVCETSNRMCCRSCTAVHAVAKGIDNTAAPPYTQRPNHESAPPIHPLQVVHDVQYAEARGEHHTWGIVICVLGTTAIGNRNSFDSWSSPARVNSNPARPSSTSCGELNCIQGFGTNSTTPASRSIWENEVTSLLYICKCPFRTRFTTNIQFSLGDPSMPEVIVTEPPCCARRSTSYVSRATAAAEGVGGYNGNTRNVQTMMLCNYLLDCSSCHDQG